jgi:hypothetical protein
MATKLRIATFNLENLDDEAGEGSSSLQRRVEVMRSQLVRLEADFLRLQEVHSQEEGGKCTLSARGRLLKETPNTALDEYWYVAADRSTLTTPPLREAHRPLSMYPSNNYERRCR